MTKTQFGNLELFTTGNELFPALENIFENAKKEILVSVYELGQDDMGSRFIGVLRRAVKRGVYVRVLFDNIELLYQTSEVLKRMLTTLGIDTMVFRPLRAWFLYHPLSAACRNHVRLFLIDRDIFGLGGMSLVDICKGRNDLFLLGKTSNGTALASYFAKLWKLGNRTSIPESVSVEQEEDSGPYRLLVSGPEKRDQEIYQWLSDATDRAQHRIRIATPFFFPERALLARLAQAARRGVAVEVVTPLRTDKPRYDWFRAVPVPYLAKHGVAWHGAKSYFHSKCCIVDDRWTLGSANIDIIGMSRNYELNICGSSDHILQKLENHFTELKNGSVTMQTQPTPIFIRILIALFHRLAERIFKLT